MMDAYLTAQTAKRGQVPVKETAHIFKALREMLGPHKPVRAVTRNDILTVQGLLKRVPANATKLYGKEVSFVEAAQRGEDEGRKTLSHNTVRTYLIHASSMWNWALAEGEGWADRNPVEGLPGSKRDSLKREGFSNDQLVTIFGALRRYKAADAARFWVPALALNGARLGELCQLLTSDVREADGVMFLDLSEFDHETGERVESKSLKNRPSARVAPIHPLVIEAGFGDFVDRRRKAGVTRLFPELRRSPQKGWGQDMSRFFAAHLDQIGLSSRKLVFHSFRHGLRTRGREAGLSGEILDAIGGWKSRATGENYGSNSIATLNSHLSKISYGHLIL
jgi:integrase